MDTRDKLIGFGVRSMRKSYYPELKQRLEELERFRALLDQAGDMIFMLSVPEALLLDANLRARTVFELGPESNLKHCGFYDILSPSHQALVMQRFDHPKETEPFEAELIKPDGSPLICELSLRLVSVSGREYAVAVARNIARRKEFELKLTASLREKEVMLREIHHRVKNNLQVISSLLSLQSMRLTDEQARKGMEECRNRIKSMSLVHERLYGTKELSSVNMAEYLGEIKNHLIVMHNRDGLLLEDESISQDVHLGLDKALPCGLIYNELYSNALTHAFAGRGQGKISSRLSLASGQVKIEICDNGVGLPPGFDPVGSGSLGLTLVNALSSQLGARLSYGANPEGGVCFELEFPI